jgi:hypothetical protein
MKTEHIIKHFKHFESFCNTFPGEIGEGIVSFSYNGFSITIHLKDEFFLEHFTNFISKYMYNNRVCLTATIGEIEVICLICVPKFIELFGTERLPKE